MKTNRLFALGLMMALASGACGGDDSGSKKDGGGTTNPDGGGTTNPDGSVVTNPDGSLPANPDGGLPANPDGGGGGGTGSKLITASGGSVTSADGRLTVTFSRYALTRPTTVTITTPATPPAGAQGTVYDIEPKQEILSTANNATTTITLSYNAADLGTNGSPSDLKLGLYEFGRWEEIGVIPNTQLPAPKANPSAMNITAYVTKLGIVSLLPGLCIACPEAQCNPDTCVTGSDKVKGKCVATGNGCSVCRPACDLDNDGYCLSGSSGGDCAGDQDPKINVAATELCNGVDDNCNGHVDEGCKTCKADTDCGAFEACTGGFCNVCAANCDAASCAQGNPPATIAGRCAPFGLNGSCNACVPACDKDGDGQCPTADDVHFISGGDCNDMDPTVKAGGSEICGNGVDDDCNGFVDDNCNSCGTDSDCPSAGLVCVAGSCVGCSTAACDPTACAANGATNGVPGKCATIGKGCNVCIPQCDGDGDGFCTSGPAGGDCKDSDPTMHPPASGQNYPEVCGNGKDDNCNGHEDEGCKACADNTACTNGLESCQQGSCQVCSACDQATCIWPPYGPTGYKFVAGTCVASVNGCGTCLQPGDMDGDGYITAEQAAKVLTDSMVTLPGPYDCDDTMAAVNPGAPEICGNGIDDNCANGKDELCTTCADSSMCGAPGACDNTR